MLNSMRRTLTRLTSGFWMVYLAGLAALTPAIAWAQTAAPAPALKRAPPVWVCYRLMAVLLGIVLAISLLPSKRSHQD